MIEEFAPAKINLSLRILGRRPDGYHELESLVSFATIGDRLMLEAGRSLHLDIADDFAADLAGEADNLVLRAARDFAAAFPGSLTGRFILAKHLPVASGLGGGSSDAAAALRLLARANGIDIDDARLREIARGLGADVTVCLQPALRVMRGIGHDLGAPLAGREAAALLINPGLGVATAAVFAQLGLAPGEVFVPAAGASANHLEAPAIALCPVIGEVLAALREAGARQVAMSGSGATCFGLFASEAAMLAAGERLAKDHGGWWIARCALLCP